MAIDYSPLFGQAPPSGVSRGLKFFGDAVGAVMERRQRMEAERARRAMDQEEAIRNDARARFGIQQNTEIARANAEATANNRREIDSDRDADRDLRDESLGPRFLQAATEAEKLNLPDVRDANIAQYRAWQERRARRPQPQQSQQDGSSPLPRPGVGPAAPQAQAQAPQPQPQPQPQPDFTVDADPSFESPMEDTYVAPGDVRPQDVRPPPVSGPPLSLPAAVARPAGAPPPVRGPAPAPAPPMNAPQAVAPGGGIDMSAVNPRTIAQNWFGGMRRLHQRDPEALAKLQEIQLAMEGDPDMGAREANTAFSAWQKQRDDLRLAKDAAGRDRENDALKRQNTESLIEARWWNSEVKPLLATMGYDKTVHDRQALEDLSTIAGGAGMSTAMATLLQGRWAKFGQGAGVLTDQDLRIFYKNMGDIAQRYGTTLQGLLTGTITPAMQKEVVGAIATLKKSTERMQNDIGARLVAYMEERGEQGRARIPRFLRPLTPSYFERWAKQTGYKAPAGVGTGASPLAPPPAPAPAGPDMGSIDATIEELKRELGGDE